MNAHIELTALGGSELPSSEMRDIAGGFPVVTVIRYIIGVLVGTAAAGAGVGTTTYYLETR